MTMYQSLPDPRLSNPCNILISGPSGAGKTTVALKLIKHRQCMFKKPIERVIYCYDRYQPVFNSYPEVEFLQNFDDITFDKERSTLLIIDDKMGKITQALQDQFTSGRHLNVSSVFLTQQLFLPDRRHRVISANCQHQVIMKSAKGMMNLELLSRQIFPRDKAKELCKCYENATGAPYSYIWLDLHPQTPDTVRVKSCVFPDEGDVLVEGYNPSVVYRL